MCCFEKQTKKDNRSSMFVYILIEAFWILTPIFLSWRRVVAWLVGLSKYIPKDNFKMLMTL